MRSGISTLTALLLACSLFQPPAYEPLQEGGPDRTTANLVSSYIAWLKAEHPRPGRLQVLRLYESYLDRLDPDDPDTQALRMDIGLKLFEERLLADAARRSCLLPELWMGRPGGDGQELLAELARWNPPAEPHLAALAGHRMKLLRRRLTSETARSELDRAVQREPVELDGTLSLGREALTALFELCEGRPVDLAGLEKRAMDWWRHPGMQTGPPALEWLARDASELRKLVRNPAIEGASDGIAVLRLIAAISFHARGERADEVRKRVFEGLGGLDRAASEIEMGLVACDPRSAAGGLGLLFFAGRDPGRIAPLGMVPLSLLEKR